MSVLSALQPTDVFHYFEEIAAIPHGSFNTKAISDYCVVFAKKHNLAVIQDDLNNVIMIKEASKGYEEVPAVILQGHLDMVCEKEADYDFDFKKDGLRLKVEGDFISAEGTTLGGDDGIAVASILALLADDTLLHPRLEVVLTVDEETGMEGAKGIDLSMLEGKFMLNLDSEEEGIFLTSCAGGLQGRMEFPVSYTEFSNVKVKINIKGLQGGHSGSEIDQYRGNANKLLGRMCYFIRKEVFFDIVALEGGKKDNAIPREASITVFVSKEDTSILEDTIKKFEEILKNQYAAIDPNVCITFENYGETSDKMLTPKSREILLFALNQALDGVIKMSGDIKGLVQTSLNLGIMNLTMESFVMEYAIRSSVKSEKEALSDQLQYLTEFLGGTYTAKSDYPSWPYQKESRLREFMLQVYEEKFHKKAVVSAIHAGLECGILLEKIPGLDVISLGPDLYDVHTPKERLSISSTARCYDYVKEILARFQNLA